MPLWYYSRDRLWAPKALHFKEPLTAREIDELASSSDVHSLQCTADVPVQPQTWDLLNQNLFPRRPDIELRVYGWYGFTCDLSFAKRLYNVRRFSADCLSTAVGVEHLAAMEQLEELGIGISSLESFDFLKTLPGGIKFLFLGRTKSKKPRLDVLDRFRSLRKLHLEGQQNGIEVLAELKDLEEIMLRSVTTPNIEYVARLPRLWSLDIKLGGIQSLLAISGKESIKYLELWLIRGLSDISVVSSLTGLQYLLLQALRNVRSVPDLSRLTKLRRLHLRDMKGLKDVSAVRRAPALEQFSHYGARNISPGQYADLATKPSLREVFVGFGNKREDQEFETLMTQSGKTTYKHSEFFFQ